MTTKSSSFRVGQRVRFLDCCPKALRGRQAVVLNDNDKSGLILVRMCGCSGFLSKVVGIVAIDEHFLVMPSMLELVNDLQG